MVKFTKLLPILLIVLILGASSYIIGTHIYSDTTPTIEHFTIIHFLGYLFFITMPVEALVPYYLSEGFSVLSLFFLALTTALLAQTIDYVIGYQFPSKLLKSWIGEKAYKKNIDRIRKHSYKVIFVFNLLPLSSPIVVLAAGILKSKFKKTFLYSFLGLAVKYFIICFTFYLYLN